MRAEIYSHRHKYVVLLSALLRAKRICELPTIFPACLFVLNNIYIHSRNHLSVQTLQRISKLNEIPLISKVGLSASVQFYFDTAKRASDKNKRMQYRFDKRNYEPMFAK